MTKLKVFQLQFAASAAVLLLCLAVIRLLWFPGGYFAISNVAELFLILCGVILVVGPGLSALLYRPGKWGLKFDLVVIVLIEAAILGWGLTAIHERRPEFLVFVVDRFEAVTMAEVDITPLGDSRLARRPAHMPRLIHAALPTDPEIMNRLIDETVFEGKLDIDRRPEFWQPYAAGIRNLKAKAKPLTRFMAPADARREAIQVWLDRRGSQAGDFIYLPLQARGGDGIVVIHPDIGYPVAILPIDPWPPFPEES